MNESKQEYLQNVLETYRMSHIENLEKKHKSKRDDIKELLEKKFTENIYSPINSGSFAKHTAINIKFDLDIAIPFKRDSFDTLENMFGNVYNFINDKYQNEATIRSQKVSIGIEFLPDKEGDIVSLDIVPGRELNKDQYPDDKNMNLYVNSKYGMIKEKTYIQTNIQAQINHIKAKENERKIIRLLKIWKNSNNEKYKSFLLELLTIKAFEKENISGNLWDKLTLVMQYIQNNVVNESFTLTDPGNCNNNVIDTLDYFEREVLSNRMKVIINNIDHNEENIKIYFPVNTQFNPDKSSSVEGYGIKTGRRCFFYSPNNQRFG